MIKRYRLAIYTLAPLALPLKALGHGILHAPRRGVVTNYSLHRVVASWAAACGRQYYNLTLTTTTTVEFPTRPRLRATVGQPCLFLLRGLRSAQHAQHVAYPTFFSLCRE